MLGVAANSISGSEASVMVKHFLAFDRDFNGTLDYQELSLATKQVGMGRFGSLMKLPAKATTWQLPRNSSCVVLCSCQLQCTLRCGARNPFRLQCMRLLAGPLLCKHASHCLKGRPVSIAFSIMQAAPDLK
jgi:hypothetical protein